MAAAAAALAALEQSEFLALREIFPPPELVIHADADAHGAVRLQVGGLRATVHLLLDPLSYPQREPAIEVEGLRRGEAAGVLAAAAALGASLRGSAMLFELLGLLREQLGQPTPAAEAAAEAADEGAADDADAFAAAPAPRLALAQQLQLVSGALETEKKSVFQGFAARVRSAEEVRAVLAHIAALPRVARATHPAMHAYRIATPSGATLADNDDDGEAGAGAKLAQLLVNMQASGVLVVVARWYGGVPLGPARFGIIANCARKVLLEALGS